MKTISMKWVMMVLFSTFALAAAAQSDLTVKVTNVPSAKGKVMIATDKGQYNMVDATGGDAELVLKSVPEGKCKLYVYHDENGNYQLDKEGDVPAEYCAIADVEVKSGAMSVVVKLVDVQKEMNKK